MYGVFNNILWEKILFVNNFAQIESTGLKEKVVHGYRITFDLTEKK